jgi:hypothetical protein
MIQHLAGPTMPSSTNPPAAGGHHEEQDMGARPDFEGSTQTVDDWLTPQARELIGRARRSDGRQTGLRMGPIGRCMLHATAGAHEACRRLERILVGARRDLESLGLFVVAGGAQQTA